MINIEKVENLNQIGRNKKKKQIVLANTLRNSREYIISLKERHNKKYQKIPNYLIDKEGRVFNLIPDEFYSKFFKKENINKNSIIIVLENLGWLEKIPLTDYYVNWIGDIYKGEIFERKWRDYFFWQPYTEEQLKTCADLCNM
jgi:N-acetyl-anhydromuramyl-L-alanine amidase AmpD